MMSTHSNNSSFVITKGGANRIIFPCVGLAKSPLSLSAIHISQAVELSSESLMTIAFKRPLPLIKLTIFRCHKS